jgi:hypothetical protein
MSQEATTEMQPGPQPTFTPLFRCFLSAFCLQYSHVSALGSLFLLFTGPAANGQTSAPADTESPPALTADERTESAAAERHFTSKAAGVRKETEPPGYARPLSDLGLESMEDLDWLVFGLKHRTRFEYRDDFSRGNFLDDRKFLLRTQAYLGIKDILDPFRFGVEFMDSRSFNSSLPDLSRDTNENDILQAFVELHFADALGPGDPFRLQVGRFSIDFVDRKYIGRNRWRNTMNAFDGIRLVLGQSQSDWQFEAWAARAVEIRLRQMDGPDDESVIYAMSGQWREWSDIATIEPWYVIVDDDFKDAADEDATVHTLGLRFFGPIGESGFDYDTNTAFQFGEVGDRDHCAFATYAELGYTFDMDWSPRVSCSIRYGSGDRDLTDGSSQRWYRAADPTSPISESVQYTWQNIVTPKLRIEFEPVDGFEFSLAHGAYWLASENDIWPTPDLGDPTGQSGSFIGQESEVTAGLTISEHLELEFGYIHFYPGSFATRVGVEDDGDLFYVQATLSLH